LVAAKKEIEEVRKDFSAGFKQAEDNLASAKKDII